MTIGTFPVPKDVRAARDFELIMGQEELLRNSRKLVDPTVDFQVGEWALPATGEKADKVDNTSDLTSPALGAKVCWTLYKHGDPIGGQSDAVATGSIDVLSGTYQAKTKLYNTASTHLQPGNILVVVYDGTVDGGILDAPDPAAYSARQLAAAVGRVISVDSGVLTYESPI